ncbi:hypothetical protein ASG01_02750 [Chryseobacterium sp. Leaf180]|uniref:nucleotidyltransferase family protein n=1 Tax=Chryseobacterium sp. Leaf180 TaxID=1736289 RepID=UPI0006FC6EF3|nr:nucleotidyltransferase family protein [Chryseobacterium sp. Leaf180]KQR94804.1 hypothetical protein ASG01_02750 [Chryseobacterium sp. Leaf180]
MKNSETAIVILAAGSSSRLGSPKQLLHFKGKTLLQNVIDEALKVTENVIVVVGDENLEILKEIRNAEFIQNKKWETGMGSSVTEGLKFILKTFPHINQCIFSVCDQPFLTFDIFIKLIELKESSHKKIVACQYSETTGVPVLFDKKYFPELLSLYGNEGAKTLLKRFSDDVATVDFQKGSVDIDTADDYEKLEKYQI